MEYLEFMEDVFTIDFLFLLKQYQLNFISAYKKSYSQNQVLIRLIENWEESRENKNLVGTDDLLGLSKAFAYTPHDLLAEKLHSYGL